MKKIFTVSFLIILALNAFAQLELKPAIGMTAARFDSDPVFDLDTLATDAKVGYQFGASLAIGRKLYVEPGVFYTRLGQDFAPSVWDDSAFTYKVNSLRIPVSFGFQFIGHNTSFAGLKIFIGPSMIIPLSVKENNYPIEKDDIKSPQFDIAVGAGLNIWLFFLDVSYGWGLTPQFRDDPIDAKMQSLYANLGFRFKLKPDEE